MPYGLGRALSSTTISLKTYTGEQVRVLGTIHVNVKYQATVATLPLLVTEANGPSLFGRNWLAALHLNVEHLNLMQQNKPLEEVLARHAAVFS